MPEKLSAVQILSVLVERVRRIERESGQIAAVLEHMSALLQGREHAAPGGQGQDKVPVEVAAPGAS